jgi:UDP-glucose 6-dehydrogenase
MDANGMRRAFTEYKSGRNNSRVKNLIRMLSEEGVEIDDFDAVEDAINRRRRGEKSWKRINEMWRILKGND